jgi:hypothetical protein
MGCSGEYSITAPDVVAPAGGEAPVVVRMQRNDFLVLDVPVEQAPVRLRIGDAQRRFAYTDKFGYAGTAVPAPGQPGRYTLSVFHQDSNEGDEVYGSGLAYVWDSGRPATAVDLDCLPLTGEQSAAAAASLKQRSRAAHVAYFTRQSTDEHDRLHDELEAAGFPDGPILLWKREYWHITSGTWNIPKVVVESRLVSQLDELKKMFPKLDAGIAGCPLSAQTFLDAGLRTIVVGNAEVHGEVRRAADWSDLAESGSKE